MNLLSDRLKSSPIAVRVVPFAVFLALTAAQSSFGESGRYWFYFLKTVAGAWMIWEVRPFIPEMKWAFSVPAVLAGIFVFVMWVGLQDFLRMLGLNPESAVMKSTDATGPWNPLKAFGDEPAIGWFFVGVRILGSSLVVPPLEEVFFRSFLYRYIEKTDFQSIALGGFYPLSFLITSVAFGFEHHEWMAGVLCGFIYQGLVCYKKRLGDAMTAHAITNFLLGVYVVSKGAWQFW
jgi:CAAX prenyl protease-like protein